MTNLPIDGPPEFQPPSTPSQEQPDPAPVASDAGPREGGPPLSPEAPEGAVIEGYLLSCVACGRRGLQGEDGLAIHRARYCPESQGRAGLAPHGLTPIPGNRPMMAWYFKPPRVATEEASAPTGLPTDVFYYASAWDASQVYMQTRKGRVVNGNWEANRLVMPIDEHGMTFHGTPIVAMHPPDFNPAAAANWEAIVALMERVQKDEIAREQRVVSDLADELKDGGFTGPMRADMRRRHQALEQHLKYLMAGIDYNALFQFFTSEAERSQEVLRPNSRRLPDAATHEALLKTA